MSRMINVDKGQSVPQDYPQAALLAHPIASASIDAQHTLEAAARIAAGENFAARWRVRTPPTPITRTSPSSNGRNHLFP